MDLMEKSIYAGNAKFRTVDKGMENPCEFPTPYPQF